MSRSMVLCAGFGSRLRPLTDELPKPLLPVGDRSLLEHALRTLGTAGLAQEVILNVHYLYDTFCFKIKDLGLDVRVLHELTLLGTAGGIAGARALLGPAPVVVQLADVMLSHVPVGLVEAASEGGLVLAVAERPLAEGNVGLGAAGEVVRLRGERFGEEIRGGQYVGLLALGSRALAGLPERGCYLGDYALPELRRGGRIQSYPFDGRFGLPGDDLESYFDANLSWLDEHFPIAPFVAVDAQVGSGVQLGRCLIGAGARVSGNGALDRVLVLPGAVARAPLAHCIVAPSGRVIPLRPPRDGAT